MYVYVQTIIIYVIARVDKVIVLMIEFKVPDLL